LKTHLIASHCHLTPASYDHVLVGENLIKRKRKRQRKGLFGLVNILIMAITNCNGKRRNCKNHAFYWFLIATRCIPKDTSSVWRIANEKKNNWKERKRSGDMSICCL